MRSRRLAAAAAGTVMAVLLVGCSDDEPDRDGGPRSGGSDTATPTAGTDDPSGDPSGDASGDVSSSPDVEAASGQRVSTRSGISFRFTEGPDWEWDGEGSTGLVADAEVEDVLDLVYLEATEIDARTDDLDVAADAAVSLAEASDRPTPRRVEDREVNGVTGYVLRSEGDEENFYLFGVLHEGTSFRISFEVPPELDLEDWVEPILASIEWS